MPVLASSQQEFSDADWRAVSSGDQSKKLKFDVSGVSANTTRTVTIPDKNLTIQAQDAMLDALAALATSAGQFIRFSGADSPVAQSIVGTVSQSGGTPTGAIIEQGSTSAGRYTRWADGTQICYGNASYSGDINTASGGAFRSSTSDMNITFPAAFSAVPSVVASPDTSLTSVQVINWASIRTASTTSVILIAWRLLSQTGVSGSVFWVAAGRWF